jgi:hypothetical protein
MDRSIPDLVRIIEKTHNFSINDQPVVMNAENGSW